MKDDDAATLADGVIEEAVAGSFFREDGDSCDDGRNFISRDAGKNAGERVDRRDDVVKISDDVEKRAGERRVEVRHAGEALTRGQAIEFYTRANAYLIFWEKESGSLEKGKRADFSVVDRDLLSCPVDDVNDAQVVETWIEGK